MARKRPSPGRPTFVVYHSSFIIAPSPSLTDTLSPARTSSAGVKHPATGFFYLLGQVAGCFLASPFYSGSLACRFYVLGLSTRDVSLAGKWRGAPVFARHRQPTGPIWPYFGLLGLLFALSVTAPRAWTPKPRVAAPRPFAATKKRPLATASLASRRDEPAAASVFRPASLTTAPVRPAMPLAPEAIRLAIAPQIAPRSLQGEGEIESLDAIAASFAPELIAIDVPPPADDADWSPELALAPADEIAANDDDAQAPEEHLALAPSGPEVEPDFGPLVETAPAAAPVAWLNPTSLLERLDSLANECECGPWALSTAQAVEAFVAADPHDLDSAAPALAVVWQRLFEGEALAEEQPRPELATAIRRACDALRRRLGVWDATLARIDAAQDEPAAADAADLGLALAAVEAALGERGDADAWREYLLLDQLRAMNEARASLADAAREQLAREVLTRLSSPTLDLAERQFTGQRRIQQLAGGLRSWSDRDESHFELARGIERFEDGQLPSDAQQLAAIARQLAAASDPREQELSLLLNERFRNANLRLEFSADFISRLLPEAEPREQAVRETILGVPNRGHSRTTTRLHVRTANQRGRLGLELHATGDIDSWTTAESGPALFRHEGRARFTARRRLRFDRHGLHAEEAQVEVDSRNELRGLETDFDRLPLLGRIAQKIARRQYDEQRGRAQAEAERRMRDKVRGELMDETETALAAANIRWRERVMTPLDRLGLKPRVIEADSRNDRAMLRLRLAADSQLGGHTPRPRLPAGTQLGLQVHQTALNNLLEGLDLNGRAFSLPELGAWLADKLNRDDLLPKNSLREDVWVHFDERDAVYARLADGQLELNLHFAELITPHRSWHNFRVRVKYHPAAASLTADLLREGPVELFGDSVGGVELVLRGILNRIFPLEEPWRLVPAQLARNPRLQGLTVHHFVIDDGWLSLGVAEERETARAARAEARR